MSLSITAPARSPGGANVARARKKSLATAAATELLSTTAASNPRTIQSGGGLSSNCASAGADNTSPVATMTHRIAGSGGQFRLSIKSQKIPLLDG